MILLKSKFIFKFIFFFGILVVLAGFAELLFFRGNTIIPIHDQLDGNLLTYILAAKHIFSQSDYLELMNGLPVQGMTMPAPAFVFLYMLFSPLNALIIMWIIISLCAYIGMYLTVVKVTKSPFIAMVSGVFFAYLPFMPIYGLSIMGIPLVIYSLWGLLEKQIKPQYFAYIAFYGLCSSVVLSGVFVIGAAVVLGLCIALFVKRIRLYAYWGGIGTLLVCFIFANFSLLSQFFGKTSVLSHKEEMSVNYVPIKDTLTELLLGKQMHTPSVTKGILPAFVALIIILFIYTLLRYKTKKNLILPDHLKLPLCTFFSCLLLNILIAIFAALCSIRPIVDFRNNLGGILQYIQLDRFYCLMPSLWYIAFGSSIYSIFYLLIELFKTRNRSHAVPPLLITCVFIAVAGTFILLHSTLWVNPIDSADPTWNELWETDLWEDIAGFINKEQSLYRVISLGLYPSIPLYNGFYCLDAYSNNYPLAYKHNFRKIIAGELEKNEYTKFYFDKWGSRCYGFSSEVSYIDFMKQTPGRKITDLDWDMGALKALGGSDVYIFSTVTIGNADALGLSYEGYFESQYRRYGIYLYRL